MDPFTQRMLERAKCRREKLDNQKLKLDQRAPLQEKVNVGENNSECETVDNKGKQFITAVRKSKLQKLAQLYSNNENECLENVDEVLEEENEPCENERKSQCKLGRLNELATKIKQWEDDYSYSKPEPKKQAEKLEPAKKVKPSEKHEILDSAMVEKLCSQGFSRSQSQSKLLYEFNKKNEVPNENTKKNIANPPPSKISIPEGTRSQVLKKAAFFESTKSTEPTNATTAKDPAELSLAERKALFERNKGTVVLPKNPYIPERKIPREQPEKIETKHKQVEQIRNCFEGKPPEVNMKREVVPEPPPLPKIIEPTVPTRAVPTPPKEVDASRTSGRLYPSLSNLDITNESEVSQAESLNDSKNSNLCLNMTLSDLLELNKNNPTTPPNEQSFSQSKECQVLNKMDKLLEDALNDFSSTEEDEDMVPSPPKMKKSSSFEYKNGSPNPLLHTVSFYRKQQQNSCLTPEKVEGESEVDSEEESTEQNESILVQNKIQALVAEVNKQQTIISQASQALNLCLSTVEFSGSGEQVEGERLLLLASHKRQACLNEIQRLKVENSLRPLGGNSFLTERGDVHLSNICIRLKRDALRSIAAAENLQYFVCLVKSDEQVLATPAVAATKENLKDLVLPFPGQLKLESLLSDFKISVEVYNLELSKELLPHDLKYHIGHKKEKKLLTPIKSKKSESKLVKPNLQSPAGPNAVRTTHFQMCGYIVFSLKEITRTQWILNKVPYVSPVEGTISMTIQSQLRLNDEFRGFLTMFDDISGFGAWHRRWCLLSSHFISYWKYPDDESKKVPIGTIDLRTVITEKVGLVSRDICARLNTFLLETTRPRLSDDKDSLVVSVKNDITTIRHLLSADSKQEMTTWCKKLNTALALLRSWKCSSNE